MILEANRSPVSGAQRKAASLATEPEQSGSPTDRPLSFKEKIRTINWGQAKGRRPKVTTDDHGTHKVDITEHWEDRQDITVRPETLRLKLGRSE